MTKSELRLEYKKKRSFFSEDQIHESGFEILEQLKKMGIWNNQFFHIFVPIIKNHEINTFPIIKFLFENGKTVVIPKVENNQMLNCKISPATIFKNGKFDVPEPTEYELIENNRIEIVFVPMLICDSFGNRIGYGGGYYDRFLVELKPGSQKIGLNFFEPVQKIESLETTDIPLDYCVTPAGIVSFGS